MNASPRRRRLLPLAVLALAAGCEEPRHVGGQSAAPPAPKKEEDTFIVGKRTTDVRKLTDEDKNTGRAAETRITAKDPITIQGNAYVTIIGRTAVGHIQHAMDLYKAENDRFPKDFDEFKAEILDKNNIALPKLPRYQEYKYDEKEHKLVVWEYPDRKNQPGP